MHMFVIPIGNQKGGVTKTTTSITLGAALARKGKRVKIADIDPQASLTEYFMDPRALELTMNDLIINGTYLPPIQLGPNIAILPTNIDLAAAEVILPSKTNFEQRLKRYIRPYEQDTDYFLIDCPPSLGVLTRNALAAANTVLIPVATEEMARRTIPLFLDQIEEVRESELNPGLHPWRILPTLYSVRETEDNEVLNRIRSDYNELVYPEPVPRRTGYKKAVRQMVDVNDIDPELGRIWDDIAALLIEETPAILARSRNHA